MITERKRLFAEAIVNGLMQREAAVFAGYAEKNADTQASRLMADQEIKTLINELKAKKKAIKPISQQIAASHEASVTFSTDDDPIEYLKTVWKDENQDPALRVNAAKAALPYFHGKVAEKGKKETKADEAKKATQGGKFGTLNNQLMS